MSYQPQPPSGGAPPPPQWSPAPPVAAPPPTPPAGERRKGLLFAGIGVAVVGLVAGGVIASTAGSTKEETVQAFARAPVGCTTTLEFEKSATFTLFVETKGSAIDVGGDCAGNGASYDRTSPDLPEVTLALVDEDDNPVELSESDSFSYDTGAFVGQAIQQVDIDSPGTYRLTVSSADTDFAIAIGGDPEADSSTVLAIGGAILLVGLLAGAVLIVLGLRRKGGAGVPPSAPAAMPPAAGWAPQPPAPGYAPAPPAAPAPPTYQQPPPAPPTPPVPPAGPGWGAPQT
ncbi:MAG: hypothetical protein HY828_19190 [Actinobacteria bacterium]|nr:hypothetical protein [Actinomycetota bacterium]